MVMDLGLRTSVALRTHTEAEQYVSKRRVSFVSRAFGETVTFFKLDDDHSLPISTRTTGNVAWTSCQSANGQAKGKRQDSKTTTSPNTIIRICDAAKET